MTEPLPASSPNRRHERQDDIVDAFVLLADTLTDDYDVIDFLHVLVARCTELVDVDDAGVMLADPAGQLHAVAASTEQVRLLELFEVQNQDGPCLDAYRTGEPVHASDLAQRQQDWPTFADEALRNGFRAAYSVPMQLRNETIGAINLLSSESKDLGDHDHKLVTALAQMATIGLLQERRAAAALTEAGGLQRALDSRIRIEQAKGVIAERHGTSVDTAFEMIRRHARNHQLGITIVADRIVNDGFDLTDGET